MDRTSRQVHRLIPGVVAMALSWGCGPGGIPSPSFPGPIESTPIGQVIEYASRVDFDTAHGAGDEQRLMLLDSAGQPFYGPLARIEPARKAYETSLAQLGEGRIVARMINLSDIPYPKLNLGPQDTTYLWVDRRGASQEAWRYFYASRDSLHRRPARPMTYHRDVQKAPKEFQSSLRQAGYYPEWKQSIARWVWDPNDEKAWVTCSRWGCCDAN